MDIGSRKECDEQVLVMVSSKRGTHKKRKNGLIPLKFSKNFMI